MSRAKNTILLNSYHEINFQIKSLSFLEQAANFLLTKRQLFLLKVTSNGYHDQWTV